MKKQEFLFFERDIENKNTNIEKIGFEFCVPIKRWIGSKSILPAYLNYIMEIGDMKG